MDARIERGSARLVDCAGKVNPSVPERPAEELDRILSVEAMTRPGIAGTADRKE